MITCEPHQARQSPDSEPALGGRRRVKRNSDIVPVALGGAVYHHPLGGEVARIDLDPGSSFSSHQIGGPREKLYSGRRFDKLETAFLHTTSRAGSSGGRACAF